jgi:protein-disulfide isomerase
VKSVSLVISAAPALVCLAAIAVGSSLYRPALAQTATTANPSPAIAAPASPAATPPAPAPVTPVMAPIDQLMAPGSLPDLAQGANDAPVTIIEYGSTTCPHCAAFHDNVFPSLKTKYIDPGKVRFIFREFPLDPLATGSFMLARCAGADKRNALIDQLFTQQKTWAFVDKPIEALLDLVKQAGMTQVDFETCLKNQELMDQVTQTRDRAAEKFNVDSTPTFFVNGRKMTGDLPISDFDKVLEPLLK